VAFGVQRDVWDPRGWGSHDLGDVGQGPLSVPIEALDHDFIVNVQNDLVARFFDLAQVVAEDVPGKALATVMGY